MTPWSFLKPIIAPYRWWLLLIFQAPIVSSGYIIINGYSFKLIIDAFSQNFVSYSSITLPIVLYVLGQILLDAAWIGSKTSQKLVMPIIKSEILLKSYLHLQNQSFSYFQSAQSGSIISKIRGIVEGYAAIFSYLIYNLSKYFFSVVISLVALLCVNKIAGCIMLLWTIAFFAFQYPMSRKLSAISSIEGNARHKIFASFGDNIANIFTIFNFARKKNEISRIKNLFIMPFQIAQTNTYSYDIKFYLVGCIFYWPILIGIFALMLHFRRQNIITSGDFAFIMTTIITMSMDLWVFIINLTDFLKEMGDFKSSFSLLQTTSKSLDKNDARILKL